jgi:hypothetical protein
MTDLPASNWWQYFVRKFFVGKPPTKVWYSYQTYKVHFVETVTTNLTNQMLSTKLMDMIHHKMPQNCTWSTNEIGAHGCQLIQMDSMGSWHLWPFTNHSDLWPFLDALFRFLCFCFACWFCSGQEGWYV